MSKQTAVTGSLVPQQGRSECLALILFRNSILQCSLAISTQQSLWLWPFLGPVSGPGASGHQYFFVVRSGVCLSVFYPHVGKIAISQHEDDVQGVFCLLWVMM